ncbi:TonB C-terminal domain-containing protein [SAR86 cluster bacterium]|jgi:colicin import membrane protein|nr:TonB C-terminal domain-containing protein [SAR86 cluster bacterium]|tara:strand:+ start:4665 stop:5276 length:612 start_codon:yes stop_codon:yes gene_type:complete
MTNNLISFINSIFFHLFLLAILTLDFSIFTPQSDREKIVPIEFISFPAIKDERAKRNNDSLSTRRNNNIEIEKEIKKISEQNNNKLNLNSLDNLQKQIEETKFFQEKKEVQVRIFLIQKRINSIWKKPSLINQNIETEIQINLAPSGEILKYEMISSSGNKIFDDSAFRALANISFITEVIGMDRNYFERNFRSFNLVFKSKD